MGLVGAEGGSVGTLPLTAADDWITLWEARTPIRASGRGRSVAHYSLRQHSPGTCPILS